MFFRNSVVHEVFNDVGFLLCSLHHIHHPTSNSLNQKQFSAIPKKHQIHVPFKKRIENELDTKQGGSQRNSRKQYEQQKNRNENNTKYKKSMKI